MKHLIILNEKDANTKKTIVIAQITNHGNGMISINDDAVAQQDNAATIKKATNHNIFLFIFFCFFAYSL